jgi:AhpD family alkylhydroperoxidase
VFTGYGDLSKAVFSDGALDAQIKELVALTVAVTKHCDDCIALHAQGSTRRGATHDEVAEALGVAVVVNGEPGTVHTPLAYAAFREFTEP